MSDLFGNHIVGFPTRRLICYRKCDMVSVAVISVISVAGGITIIAVSLTLAFKLCWYDFLFYT